MILEEHTFLAEGPMINFIVGDHCLFFFAVSEGVMDTIVGDHCVLSFL